MHGPSKIVHKRQPTNLGWQIWAFILPPKEDFQTLLGLFTALSLSVNHVYTTETFRKELGKEQRTLCKGFTYKNFTYTPVHWDKCQTKLRKLMFVANHTIVAWGPHGMWLSDCSDDINNTVCDMEGHWHYDGTLLWQTTSWVTWPWISPTSS